MQQKFLKNIAFLLLVNIVVKPFGILVIEPAVQNTVGTAQYGLYNALFSLTMLLNIFLDCGITNFNNRNISRNKHLLDKHVGALLTLRMVLALVYLIITIAVAFAIGYGNAHWHLLLILCINQVLMAFILYLRSNIAALQLFRYDSLISIADRAILIMLSGFLLLSFRGSFTIEWFAYCQLAAYSITLVIAMVLLLNNTASIALKWQWPFNVHILRKSLPYALLILLMSFYYRVDVIMLERLLPYDGALQSGIYAQAFRLLEAGNMLGYLFAVLLLPMFASMLKQHQPVESLTKLSFTVIFIPVMLAAIACRFYSEQFMQLLYSQHTEESAKILSIIMISLVCICTNYIFGTLLTANGSMRALNILAFAGMVINISLNAWLIPNYKALGAAIAGTITQLFMTTAEIVLTHRMFHFKIDWALLFRMIALVVLSYALFYLCKLVPAQWWWQLCLATAVSIISVFALRLINISDVKKVLVR